MADDSAPHMTSLVVWDVSSPAAAGGSVHAKIGVHCPLGCSLSGRRVSVCRPDGSVVGEGVLGTVPLGGTDALYWTDATFDAPAETGVTLRLAAFAGDDASEPRHLGASTSFTFRTDRVPEHVVTIRVVDRKTALPIHGVEVRMDLYAGCTDERGDVRFELPGGPYTCSIRKPGYDADPVTLEVNGDLKLSVEAGAGLTREEFDAKLSSYEDHPWG